MPEGTHRALMNLWDANSNPNDMHVDDDESAPAETAAATDAPRASAAEADQVSARLASGDYDEAKVIKVRRGEQCAPICSRSQYLQCQSAVRGMLARRIKLPKARKDFNKNRKAIMREIVNTESTYVKHLETLVDLYWDNLSELCKSNELGSVTSSDLDAIFPSCTRDIKRIAEETLEKLNKQLTEAKSVEDLRFGRVFCELAPSLRQYSAYVTDWCAGACGRMPI